MPASSLALFTAATQQWFRHTFKAATPAQQQAWRAISSGKNCLVIAPTGSGKTLAAFLYAIDALFRERSGAELPERSHRTRILYLSPVKALAADVQRNLQRPLAGVADERRKLGEPEIAIEVGMRSGDTLSSERAKLQRRPPDILITTPESLFLMLTSKARDTLSGISTVIVDEVHAVAGSKRGAHLALSLERLDALLAHPAQRIGLSATVKPPEAVAQFLGGSRETLIVNPAAQRPLQLTIRVPVEDMTDIQQRPDSRSVQDATLSAGSIWPHIEAGILDEVLRHRATLVFTNSRGLAEKLTARLNELYMRRLGEQPPAPEASFAYGSFTAGTEKRNITPDDLLARSHHGSVSKEQRLEIENALKAGELRCVVATSSLELGIDMGDIDLVIQVGAPPSVASALQRVGRAGHQVGGTPKGIIWPRTRRDLVDAAVIVESMMAGELDAITLPHSPLDLLAQHTVAAASMDTLEIDSWFELVRRAEPFKTLPRNAFDAVLDMLAGRYPSDEFANLRPRVIWDRQNNTLTGRPGAQHLAVTSGGTIPDRGMFSVMLPEGEEQTGARRVGELDEEMVYESRINDIITLGATSWRIQQITHDQVVVVPAPGRSARLPFWHGDSLGRSATLGETIGGYLRHASNEASLPGDSLDANARHNIKSLIAEQIQATGELPTDRNLLIERCRDETGDWRLILHSPYGQRVHAPWALAVAERIGRIMGIDPAVVASDDGIVARFPDSEGRVPGAELFLFEPDELQRVVTASVGHSALFAARFRECAARALLLPRRNPGKRSPLWQQRLRAGQLLEVARQFADFPILIETARECLQDVYDLPALHHLMARIHQGDVRLTEVTTETPSPFAAPLLFGYVAEFMYASDAPQAERRASMLALDSNLLSDLLGQVDMRELLEPAVIARVEQELQRTVAEYQARSIEALIDMLRELGPLSTEELAARFTGDDPLEPGLLALQQVQRIINVNIAGTACWTVAEDAIRLHDALGCALPDNLPAALLEPVNRPLHDLLGRYARTHAVFTSLQVAQRFGLGRAVVDEALEQLRQQNKLFKGDFLSPEPDESAQWAAESVFRRLRVRSLQSARDATQPVVPAAYVAFLLERQGLLSDASARQTQGAFSGLNGVVRVIEQLAGVVLPVSLWESQIFPARVRDYQPAMLDELFSSGEVIWVGHTSSNVHDGLVSLHLTEFASETIPALDNQVTLSPIEAYLLALMQDGAGWFVRQLLPRITESLDNGEMIDPTDVYQALWQLIWRGVLTIDTWSALRHLSQMAITPKPRPVRARHGRHSRASFNASRAAEPRLSLNTMAGRWSLIPRQPIADTERALALAENMLDRFGVITRGSAIAEQIPGGFPALQPVLRGMEDAGRLLRGRFIAGMGAAQFADNPAIDRLRQLDAGKPVRHAHVVVSAVDPANPYGLTLPWPLSITGAKPTRRTGAFVVIASGHVLLYLPPGGKELMTFDAQDSDEDLHAALVALGQALKREKHLNFILERINDQSVGQSSLLTALKEAGFSRVPKGYSWDGYQAR
ncbi:MULTISPECIES: ATP-dependent helicase [unclassified Pantoea]|uniref:ATP-dependent helicase n=1 Tax=unclassified Pantoea TaxID=2630326 RepID=UPI001CD670D4|nr:MULTISPECIES: ATP-dependent helicase [unclassified Pantoea]MCA1174965.1 ATP-dependent helicase [Pantoea sp. alder69]MCA1249927.1 ATP-dependent helicase [Pantoea sp. alder70]MCA1264118.1 ATP-dependent helicase [Pantoea sp. alder81]